jgi:glycosyltransferase involved in cell wall biosynthesis
MIACIAKNDRGRGVFARLRTLDARYHDLGFIEPDRGALWRGFLKSATPDLLQMKRDARVSPDFLNAVTARCVAALDAVNEPIEALLYWGATNIPVDANKHKFPYFVVTDGPFDPDDPTYPIEWKPQRWAKTYFEMQRELYRGAAHVFGLSQWAADKVADVHGVARERVSKCGWGPLGNYGPPTLDPPTGKKLFLSVGSEWRRKGMDVVSEAGAAIHAENPDVETIIAGVPVDLQLPARKGVHLLATHTPSAVVHSLMRQATGFIIAARFDASPHVIYEALQYGTPVIGTRTCGVPEAIDEPNGGLVIEGPDASLLADAMRRLLAQDPKALRQSAYNTYLQAGDWQGCAERIHSVIQAALR